MQLYGFNKLTLLDYPGHLAAILFTGGCNMRCPFCQNASLVVNPSEQTPISEIEIFDLLNKRKNILEGVCISGGEPTLNPDLPDFICKIKSLGYKVKLDTNGYNPAMMKELASHKLVDYIAMDIKNSKEKYSLTSGIHHIDMNKIEESVAYLLSTPIDYEFRTTIVKELHNEEDIQAIGQWINGAKSYYLQSYKDSGDIISPGYHSHSKETLTHFKSLLTPYIKQVAIRGID